ncbi:MULTISPECIES: hypothetical protein [Gammaproteobacteria]|uniref:Uncharacterized protein n=2 Tax=Gammaproteobacteria TaxID=1236 RepID=A0A4S2I4I2_ACIBA|nr:hypothetical protein [uncultured bacterium]ARG33571.1 hypothetical protein B7L46_00985 [Acinetobacter baumannii]EJL6989819.1 hypothetical protein [Vibrio cholerae]MCE0565781.1 hypothetical protein [Escherichia coli]PUH14657.1 hypothetical protein DB353_26680 [Klebsiella pneumoniae]
MGSCAAPSAKGDDKFITTDYLQQCLLATPKAPANTNGKKSRKANLMGTYSYDFKTGECFS